MLAGAGCALAGSAAGQMLFGVARAQQAAAQPTAAGLCMTMLFMNSNRAKFDTDKYIRMHLPLLTEVYGDSVERIELRTTAGSAMGVPSAILASTTLWIRDVPGFGQKLAANAERINKDLDSVSRGTRLVQVDRIALELGEARGGVSQNDDVFSMFYPSKPMVMGPRPGRGGPEVAEHTFDTRYFLDVYLPKLYSMFGSSAVRRLEATLGQDQGGQPATHRAAFHLMVRDRTEYESRAGSVFSEMQKDAGKFTNIIVPLLANMRVNAIV
jgi:hypothetical protein